MHEGGGYVPIPIMIKYIPAVVASIGFFEGHSLSSDDSTTILQYIINKY